jgi:hypothetical protein
MKVTALHDEPPGDRHGAALAYGKGRAGEARYRKLQRLRQKRQLLEGRHRDEDLDRGGHQGAEEDEWDRLDEKASEHQKEVLDSGDVRRIEGVEGRSESNQGKRHEPRMAVTAL